jgi:hypothetical protein
MSRNLHSEEFAPERLPSPDDIRSHFVPRTSMGRLFLAFNVICFLLVYWPIVKLFNQPVAVLGMPLLYVWVTSVGIIWCIGVAVLGFRLEGFTGKRR